MKPIQIIKRGLSICVILLLAYTLMLCSKKPEPGTEEHIRMATAIIDDDYLTKADQTPENWVTYGKNYSEDRFSSLDQINSDNVSRLGLAWAHQTLNHKSFPQDCQPL